MAHPLYAVNSLSFLFHLMVIIIYKITLGVGQSLHLVRSSSRLRYFLLTGLFLMLVWVPLSSRFSLMGRLQQYWRLALRPPISSTHTPTALTTTATPTPAPKIELMGWLAWWDQPQALISLKGAPKIFSSLSPSWYHISPDLKIVALPNLDHQSVMKIASQSGMQVLPTIGNDLDSERVARFLGDPQQFRPSIDYLIKEAIDNGYQGYDIDFESIPTISAQAYLTFLKDLKTQLNAYELTLSVAVHARSGSQTDWALALSHDYDAIGQIADQVRIMAYDFHAHSPGAITPIDDLKEVLTYAQAHLPPTKIVLGLPLYGYDWATGGDQVGVTYQQAIDLLTKHQGQQKRDSVSGALSGSYTLDGVVHTLWFEDAFSTVFKIDLAQEYGVNRFVFWRLGGEDPNTWPFIASSAALLHPGK